jgi:hypothetical protein
MINLKDRYDSENRKYRHSIKRSVISPNFPDTIEERAKEYLVQVGYEIISSDTVLVARRTYTRNNPVHVDALVTLKFMRDNGQTRIDIDYRTVTMFPWEIAYYFAELKEIKAALTNDLPVTRKPATRAILLVSCLVGFIAAIVIGVGVALTGAYCVIGIMKILPFITHSPEQSRINLVIAMFITVLLFCAIFSYFYLRYRRSKIKEW